MASNKSNDLVITDFSSGIGPSPHLGFGDMRNVDIYTFPGVVIANNPLEKVSGSVVTGLPLWADKHPTVTKSYQIDDAGVVYVSTDAGASWAKLLGNAVSITIASPGVFTSTAHGFVATDKVVFSTTGTLPTGVTAGTTYFVIATDLTADSFKIATTSGGTAIITTGSQSGTHTVRVTTGAFGQGLKIWNDYLFIARTTKLDVYGPISGSALWVNNWQTIDSDTLWHPMYQSFNDSKLYGGAGRYVFSVEELTTFDPNDSGTFTYTAQALDLPKNYRIKCISEIGNNLEMGTWVGTSIVDNPIATLFPWDRSSPSFSQPLEFRENGINQMINIDEILWIQAGTNGKYFKSNGVQFSQVAQLPSYIINLEGNLTLDPLPGAMANFKGRPFFGVSSSFSNNIPGMGVWSINQNSKGVTLMFEMGISTGNYGASSVIKIGSLLPYGNQIMNVGWRDASTYGIDQINPSSRYGNYLPYVDSPFYHVGNNLEPRQFTQIEFELAKALAGSQSIKLQYRTDLSASFTDITGTPYAFSDLGAVLSINTTADIPACEFIQIRVLLGAAGNANGSPQLRSVTLR